MQSESTLPLCCAIDQARLQPTKQTDGMVPGISRSCLLLIVAVRFKACSRFPRHQTLVLVELSAELVDVAPEMVNAVRSVWEAQTPVVTVVALPLTTSTTTVSEKMSKLRPKASGFRLK